MPRITVNAGQLGSTLRRTIIERVRKLQPHQILVAQAKDRMWAGGDSEHTYPDLWEHPESYRAGGMPLLDNGRLAASLTGTTTVDGDTVRVTLASPLEHAQYHQNGFKTKGPNFIPLTLKARRTHRKGEDPKAEGLVPGEDYVMAWNGVEVPQRKIYNQPPENRKELGAAITSALGGL